jgi:GT2 family glycosyltransferase
MVGSPFVLCPSGVIFCSCCLYEKCHTDGQKFVLLCPILSFAFNKQNSKVSAHKNHLYYIGPKRELKKLCRIK